MFRYDQNVQNRDEVPPSTDPWTSSSPLITTVVTVGSTCERMSAFCIKNKKIIISSVLSVLVISSVATTSGIFISRAGSHQESGVVTKGSMVEAPVDTLQEQQPAGEEVHMTHHHKPKKHHRQYQNPTTTTTSSTERSSEVVTAKSVVAMIHPPKSSVSRSEESGHVVNPPVENGTDNSSVEVFTTTTPSAKTGDVDKVVTPKDVISNYSENTTTSTTTSTTTTPAPTPKPCDRDPEHHRRAWINITMKNPISVLNEMNEEHSFTFESCIADGHKKVFRSTVLLLCDESHYTSGFALKKQKSKELAARAACESIYKIKFKKDLEPDFPSAQDCKTILSVNE